MLKLYFKQAIKQLKAYSLFALISIFGTALSISMIMIVVSIYQIKHGDYKPEVNRNKTLYVKSLILKNEGYSNSSNWGLRLAKECFSSLKTPKMVSFVSRVEQTLLETSDHSLKIKGDRLYTDAVFWRIFKFRFIDGQAFVEEDISSDSKRVVIAESVAKQLFQSSSAAIGQSFLVGRKPHTICGVVEDVSPLAVNSYAQVWIPYSGAELTMAMNEGTLESMNGAYQILLTAHSDKDFPAIRKEVEQRVSEVNQGFNKWKIHLLEQPDTFFTNQLRIWTNQAPDVKTAKLNFIVMILVLLFIPAMNLSGLSSSSIQNRLTELGVRKAFGATKGKLYVQILTENFIVTLLGGIVGLLCSYTIIALMKDKLFGSYHLASVSSDVSLSMGMLFQPIIFIYALIFCFCLNLLSVGIPAWHATRKPIVYALKQELI